MHAVVYAVLLEPLVEDVFGDEVHELVLCDEVVVLALDLVFTGGSGGVRNRKGKFLRMLLAEFECHGPPARSFGSCQDQWISVWVSGLDVVESEIFLGEFINIVWFLKQQFAGVVVQDLPDFGVFLGVVHELLLDFLFPVVEVGTELEIVSVLHFDFIL